jgi:hypothetical protein
MVMELGTRGSVSASEAADALSWFSAQLAPIRVLGVGTAAFTGALGELKGLLRGVECDPLADEQTLVADADGDPCWQATAVSVYGGQEELNITRDPRRSSLLEPNRTVVARYGSAADFEVRERRAVPATTLRALTEEHGAFDVLRLDAQGLEYQLLSSDLATVGKAGWIEVNGGLVDNYVGQYPLTVIAPLMHGVGYSLLELDTAARPIDSWDASVRHQPIEYRAVWVKDDLVHASRATGFEQALKILMLSKVFGYYAFGHDLAVSLSDRSLLPKEPARTLRKAGFWMMPWNLGRDGQNES